LGDEEDGYWPGMLPEEFPKLQDLPRQLLFGPVMPSSALRTRSMLLAAFLILLGAASLLLVPAPLGIRLAFAAGGGGLLMMLGFMAALLLLPATSLALARLGRVPLALRLMNLGVRLLGSIEPFVLPRAQLLLGCGFTEEAAEYLEARWRDLPSSLHASASATLGTAIVLLETDPSRAELLLRAALRAHPAWLELKLPLGMALYQQHRYAEAAQELEAGAPLIEEQRRVRREVLYFSLGDCYARQGDRRKAGPWFKRSREVVDRRRKAIEAGRNQG